MRAGAATTRATTMAKPLVPRIAILGVIWILFVATQSGYGTDSNLFAVLQGFAFLGLMTLAVGVTMFAGELDLSVGSLAAVAGIVSVKLLTTVPLIPAVVLTVCAAAAFGATQGYAIARLRINSVVFTIGTMFALRGVAFILSGESAVLMDIDKLDVSDSIIQRLGIFSPFSLVVLAAMVLVGGILGFSRWGREIYAVGGGRPESLAAGVPQRRPISLAFAISAAAAALAGVLASVSSGSGAPFAFENVLLTAVTAALIGGVGLYGGRGNMFNIALGALIIQSFVAGLSGQGATQNVQKLATAGLLLLAIVVEFVTAARARRALLRRSTLHRTRAAQAIEPEVATPPPVRP